jgi:hypothetical protein
VNYTRHSRKRLEARRVDTAIVPDYADGCALRSRQRPRFISHFLNDTNDALDVLRRRVVLHDH